MKIVCVGRNYRAHAEELKNPVPTEPVLFMKPESSLVPLAPSFLIPRDQGTVHHEIELAVRVKEEREVEAIAVALDLTLRDLQTELKAKGLPWERAKAFAGACPISSFVPVESSWDLQDLWLELRVNGELRQKGHTGEMIFSVSDLIETIDRTFSLEPGDILLTGTPAGVGPLEVGDELTVEGSRVGRLETQVLG